MAEQVLAIDIGGSKIAMALVDRQGVITQLQRETTNTAQGAPAFLEQLIKMISGFSNYRMISIGSAGPLDPRAGTLLDPTNFFTDGQSWGECQLVQPLHDHFRCKVILDNDAAVCTRGEILWGDARTCENFMVVTLGTGVGVGVVSNGQLVRSGRNLHPEASHIPLNRWDLEATCGCGWRGCIESYLSGINFSKRLSKKVGKTLSGEDVINLAKNQDPQVLKAFDDYAAWFAESVASWVVLFSPEKVILAGGFAEAHPYFLEKSNSILKDLLERRRVGVDLLPQLSVSSLKENLGVLGAAANGFLSEQK